MARATTSEPARPRGRPRGRTQQGEQSRQHLYDVATRLIATRGWHQTTLRGSYEQLAIAFRELVDSYVESKYPRKSRATASAEIRANPRL